MQLGLQTYRDAVAAFGLEKPWTRIAPLHDTHHGADKRVVVRSYDDLMQQPGEGAAMDWRVS